MSQHDKRLASQEDLIAGFLNFFKSVNPILFQAENLEDYFKEKDS